MEHPIQCIEEEKEKQGCVVPRQAIIHFTEKNNSEEHKR